MSNLLQTVIPAAVTFLVGYYGGGRGAGAEPAVGDRHAEPGARIGLSRAYCLDHERRRLPRQEPVIDVTSRMCPRSPTDRFTAPGVSAMIHWKGIMTGWRTDAQ